MLTEAQMREPIRDALCLRCDGPATIYPYPWKIVPGERNGTDGTTYCDRCTNLPWFKDFLEFSSANAPIPGARHLPAGRDWIPGS